MNLTLSPRIRKSPYHDVTTAAGMSDCTVYNKMILPLSYGDRPAEYQRLMTGVAIWDVAAERQVEISGPDASACAQYLVARDLTNQRVGQGFYVAVCDHDGRLLNDPVLLKLAEDRYWLSLADSDLLLWCRAVAAERGFDVQVHEPDVSPLAVQGPLAVDLIADLFGDEVRELRYFGFVEQHLRAIPLILCRSGWSKQGGYELFLRDSDRASELWNVVMAAGEPYGIGPGAPNHVERVESGLLSFGGDTTPDSNPLEAGMARFVQTDIEPDFIGKAALQRVVAEGPERLLVGLLIDTDDDTGGWPLPQRSPVCVDGRQVGTLSAVVHSPRLDRLIGIGQIDRRIVEAGTRVEIESTSGTAGAEVTSLPFL